MQVLFKGTKIKIKNARVQVEHLTDPKYLYLCEKKLCICGSLHSFQYFSHIEDGRVNMKGSEQ